MPAASETEALACGFPPVVGTAPRVLVLGSLPGRASIAAAEYYAMPRNAFWPVMRELCGAGPEIAYAERLQRLQTAGIALWDVLHAAVRPGSLDTAIVSATEQPNDIARLTDRWRSIRLIAFNGQKAAALFRRHVEPTLTRDDVKFVTLPSTSPAHASMRQHEKLEHWRIALLPYLRAA